MAVAVVTGGSSGIGLATARRLAQRGLDVWLVARDEGRLQAALEGLRALAPQGRHHALSCDVTDAQAVEALAARLLHEAGPPRWLVNAAGDARPGYFWELPTEVFHDMMAVNYFGTVNLCRALMPAMMQAGQGHVVNIASVAGFLGVFGYTAYAASKFAVWGFSEALRAEVRPYGLTVSVVFPPDTDTPQLARENRYKPPETRALAANAGLLQPDKVAEALIRGAERGRFLILPGEACWIWLARRLLGGLVYPVLDYLIARAQRRQA